MSEIVTRLIRAGNYYFVELNMTYNAQKSVVFFRRPATSHMPTTLFPLFLMFSIFYFSIGTMVLKHITIKRMTFII